MKQKILIIDDDLELRKSFSRILQLEGYRVVDFHSAESGLEYLTTHQVDLVLLDFKLPQMDGISCLKAIKNLYPNLPVIIITAYGTSHTTIESMKIGAFDYILKPFEVEDFLKLIQKALKKSNPKSRKKEIDFLRISSNEFLIGKSKKMQEVYKKIGKIASTQATVLILGETGTGKELIAKAIHKYSTRKKNPFIIVNCVAIPENLLESELFGYEKGAFTGASQNKKGKVELADGGSLFLDEIGDMPLSIQAKFLRFLESRSIERLGGQHTIPIDTRIISATNKNLKQAIKTGTFRKDLYYRLQVLTLTLPPLRERKNDIPLLTNYFLKKWSKEFNLEPPFISKDALKTLESYYWPGNIRELSNTVSKLIIQNKSGTIAQEDVENILFTDQQEYLSPQEIPRWAQKILHSPQIQNKWQILTDQFQYLILEYCLKKFKHNKSEVARYLGVTRPTILNKIEKMKKDKNK
ncbi:sigma-54-dependent transcriptional regulator [Desulfonauticus submarinus]